MLKAYPDATDPANHQPENGLAGRHRKTVNLTSASSKEFTIRTQLLMPSNAGRVRIVTAVRLSVAISRWVCVSPGVSLPAAEIKASERSLRRADSMVSVSTN